MDAFPDIRTLVPHAGPSCLLDAVVEAGPTHTECRATIKGDHPYLSGDGTHSLLAIELFAQAAAVHRRLAPSRDDSEAQSGLLAGASIVLEVPRLEAGSTLRVRVRQEAALGRLLRFAGELFLDGESGARIAHGEVSVAPGGTVQSGEPSA